MFDRFEPFQFVEKLVYMGVGMLGVFMIIGIIIISTYIIGATTSRKKGDK